MEKKLRRKMRGWMYAPPVPPRGAGENIRTQAVGDVRRKREEVGGREVVPSQVRAERKKRRWEIFLSLPPKERGGNHEERGKRWRRQRIWKPVLPGKLNEGGEQLSKTNKEAESSAKARRIRRMWRWESPPPDVWMIMK